MACKIEVKLQTSDTRIHIVIYKQLVTSKFSLFTQQTSWESKIQLRWWYQIVNNRSLEVTDIILSSFQTVFVFHETNFNE